LPRHVRERGYEAPRRRDRLRRSYVALRDAKTSRQFDEPVSVTISDAGAGALTAKLDVLLDFQATFDALHWPRSPERFAD